MCVCVCVFVSKGCFSVEISQASHPRSQNQYTFRVSDIREYNREVNKAYGVELAILYLKTVIFHNISGRLSGDQLSIERLSGE